MERTVETQKKRSMALEIWRRLRKNKMAMLGLVILVMLALTAIFADVIADYDTKVIAQDIKTVFRDPVWSIGAEPMSLAVIFLPVWCMVPEFLWLWA